MQTSLLGIAKKAQSQKGHRFQNLFGMLDEQFLLGCWSKVRKSAASGVDRMSAYEYGKNLTHNVGSLVQRLKAKQYRARLIRRQYIPKGDGKMRPLGIPIVEDKLLQLAVAQILNAIYEEDFLPCSYGYRPGIGAHNAVNDLTVKLQFGRYRYVVEADIKGFFDNIDHDWLLRMLALRIDDQKLLGLIRKWLKAGILEPDGKVIHPVTGTPQGGIISPILANLYLHFSLDMWFEKVVKKHCKGGAYLVRYADDFACTFTNRNDAERFYGVLGKRLGKFGLTLSAEKTRIIPLPRGDSKASFDFLGFQFRWGKDRSGKDHMKRRTAPKKLQKSLAAFTAWCKENRSLGVRLLFEKLNQKLSGYYNYFGIVGNSESIQKFDYQAKRILFKWINRRSQRKSYSWANFIVMITYFQVPEPRIRKRWPARFAEASGSSSAMSAVGDLV